MTNSIALSPEQFIFAQDKELKTTSLKVAEAFNKRHADVLRSIDKITSQVSDSFNKRNFALIQIDTDLGKDRVRKDKAYEMTKDGFMVLVMSYTGKKAMAIKESYIEAFNIMYDKLFPITIPQTITEAEALQVKKAIQSICKADRNKYSDTYNKIYEYYGITSYKNIPEGKAKEAVDLIHGELLPLKKVGEQSGPFYSLDEIFKHSENRVSKELHEYKQRILIIINDGVPTITFIPNDIMMISEEDIPEMVSFYMPTYRLVKKEKIKNVEKMISELTGAK